MAIMENKPLALLLLVLSFTVLKVATSARNAMINRDPQVSERHEGTGTLGESTNRDKEREYSQCRQRCQEHYPHDRYERQRCERHCDERDKQEGHGHGGGERDGLEDNKDPDQELSECRKECQVCYRHDRHRQQQCQRRCEVKYEKQRGGGCGRDEDVANQEKEKERRRGESERDENRDAYDDCREHCRKYHKHDRSEREACESRCEKYREPGGRAEERDVAIEMVT